MHTSFYNIILALFSIKNIFIDSNINLYCKKGSVDENNIPCNKYFVPLYAGPLISDEYAQKYTDKYFDLCTAFSPFNIIEPNNLGQQLLDGNIIKLPFNINYMDDVNCKLYCEREYSLHKDWESLPLKRIQNRIRNNYQHKWFINDGSPTVNYCYSFDNDSFAYCQTYFPLGCDSTSDYCPLLNKPLKNNFILLYNHFDFNFYYLNGAIVLIIIKPKSIAYSLNDYREVRTCSSARGPLIIDMNNSNQKIRIFYTYSIKFVKFEQYISHNSKYLNVDIVISIICVLILILSVLIGRLFYYIFWKSKKNTNNIKNWKIIENDVFTAPKHPLLFSVIIGSGVQIILTVIILFTIYHFHLMGINERGNLLTFAIYIYILMSIAAGYVSQNLYKCFTCLHESDIDTVSTTSTDDKSYRWLTNVFLTASLCPGFIYFLFLLIQVILLFTSDEYERNSSIIKIMLHSLPILWLIACLPMTFIGSCLGYNKKVCIQVHKKELYTHEIPKQKWYRSTIFCTILSSITICICITMQHFYLLINLWSLQQWKNDVLNPRLYLTFILLFIICSEITILFLYSHLSAENYRWWWRSFITCGFSGVIVFIKSLLYLFYRTEIVDTATLIVYTLYSLIGSVIFGLMTGTISFLAALLFIRKLYAQKLVLNNYLLYKLIRDQQKLEPSVK